MGIKELKAKLEAAFAQQKELSSAIEKAADEAAKVEARKSFDAKRLEVADLKAKLDAAIQTAEEEKNMSDSLKRAGAMTSVSAPAGAPLAGGAQVKDVGAELRVKESCFLKYMEGGAGNLSGEEFRLMQPSTQSKFDKGAGGCCMPLSFRLKMLGTKWAQSVGISRDEILHTMKASTMVSGTPALGGYTVPEDFRLPMLELATEMSHILPRATVIPCPTGEVTMPKAKQTDGNEYGGMVGEWIEEAGLKPKTDTRFEQVKIAAHEYAMHTQISIRLLNRSAIAMENWLATTGRKVCLDALDTAFINGDGIGKPLGILQTDGIREVQRQTPGTVVRADLVNLKYKLLPFHRAGAVYVMNDGVCAYLEATNDNEGKPLFQASAMNGMFDRLQGFPFVSTTRNPDMGTDGDVMFVDLREYYVPMEQDIVVKRSDDYDIVHNVATIVIFVVAGGKLVQPRVCAILGDQSTS
jgi:HK97 family phage major capsid protein